MQSNQTPAPEFTDATKTAATASQRGLREPGKVRAGASATTEWTWERPPESLHAQFVGVAGEGTVIRAQGIDSALRPSVPRREAVAAVLVAAAN